MKKSLGKETLLYPTPVWMIGTYDIEGESNIMTASWAGISCSNPPCVSVSLRKATYTYGNIIEQKAFTVNIPQEKQIKQADACGMPDMQKLNTMVFALGIREYYSIGPKIGDALSLGKDLYNKIDRV